MVDYCYHDFITWNACSRLYIKTINSWHYIWNKAHQICMYTSKFECPLQGRHLSFDTMSFRTLSWYHITVRFIMCFVFVCMVMHEWNSSRLPLRNQGRVSTKWNQWSLTNHPNHPLRYKGRYSYRTASLLVMAFSLLLLFFVGGSNIGLEWCNPIKLFHMYIYIVTCSILIMIFYVVFCFEIWLWFSI